MGPAEAQEDAVRRVEIAQDPPTADRRQPSVARRDVLVVFEADVPLGAPDIDLLIRELEAAPLGAVFHDDHANEDTIVAWITKPYGYIRVRNTEKGLTFYDVLGTKRFVPFDTVRTSHLPVALGESPLYIVGEQGIKATPRPDPGW